jgi:SAM-dependent methyltransferase
MGLIGGAPGYRLLKLLSTRKLTRGCDGSAYHKTQKLEALLGESVWSLLRDKRVLDFGCGEGADAVQIALHGARRVLGIDIRESVLSVARQLAEASGVSECCFFCTTAEEKVDVVVSVDSFEHFSDPEGVLRLMRSLLVDQGRLVIAFGPTWYHPYGGHLFSVFPWAHLVFTESALIRWRSDFKNDGATSFGEVEGGLNCMTISRFERILASSQFEVQHLELVPIRQVRRIYRFLPREFFTAIVRCTLVPRR